MQNWVALASVTSKYHSSSHLPGSRKLFGHYWPSLRCSIGLALVGYCVLAQSHGPLCGLVSRCVTCFWGRTGQRLFGFLPLSLMRWEVELAWLSVSHASFNELTPTDALVSWSTTCTEWYRPIACYPRNTQWHCSCCWGRSSGHCSSVVRKHLCNWCQTSDLRGVFNMGSTYSHGQSADSGTAVVTRKGRRETKKAEPWRGAVKDSFYWVPRLITKRAGCSTEYKFFYGSFRKWIFI